MTFKMTDNQKDFDTLINEYKKTMALIPDVDQGAELKVISVLKISNKLLYVMENLDLNPYEYLFPEIQREIKLLKSVQFSKSRNEKAVTREDVESVAATKKLYENIWTIYNNDTYDHSMRLCLKRYEANGFDEDYFAGKIVFDGGCGTGRFCVAAALMGAKKVYGMDLGGQSLQFAQEKSKEYQVDHIIEFIEGDVTNLERFKDESIDFVVSNGVLHHTSAPIKGLFEHYRVLKKGGRMWLYLYGKNGLLWRLYDVFKEVLKKIGPEFSRALLLRLDVRQGMVYSFMDNVFAPIRNYYNTSEIITQLKTVGRFSSLPMRGINYLDDYTLQTASKYGDELLGEECEVRQIIEKE